jgi:dTMP kinase
MGQRGKLITLEGIDGAGKSTHVGFLADILRARGQSVVLTREPGGTPLGEKIRALVLHETMDAETETLLMFAARREHVARVIEPALARGEWVICDRFVDASYAYQGGGRGVRDAKIKGLETWVLQGLSPDLTLLFDLDPAAAKARQTKAGLVADKFEQERQTFFDNVRGKYLERAKQNPQRIVIVDAAQSIDAIQHSLRDLLRTF